jgi:pyrroline-5-carboxylate reductase
MEAAMKLGFIGVGNMGGAIIKGYIASGEGEGGSVAAYDKDGEKLAAAAERLGIRAAGSVGELVSASDVVALAVKPGNFEELLPQVAEAMDGQVIVSMAAGISRRFIEGYLGESAKVIRIMPNTPAMVGESMTAASCNANVSRQELEGVMRALEAVGKAARVDESLMDVVTGLSGSSPAYVYMFIDAMTKCAAANGMDPAQARAFAAQAVLGAAKMVIETGEDPATLRQNVCSPGGTTIEAVETLNRNGFEESIIEGMQAAVDKSKKLTR